jgi:stearoyl-CoA desaturase (delta-9 desaturase)
MEKGARGRFRWGLFGGLIGMHLASFGGAYYWPVGSVSWVVLAAALAVYVISSLGISVGYHRYFTHGSFKCPEWVKYMLAAMGALAGEGTLAEWVRNHRQHHAYTEKDGDPHSPWRYRQPLGFVWAHLGWLLWETVPPKDYHPIELVRDRAVIRWQERWYWSMVVAGFVVPLLLWGWSGLVWVGFVRTLAHLHVTWCVNSVCHLWGTRPWALNGAPWTNDQSRNNAMVALFTSGEGWHGNHHVKQNAADLGRDHWWDPGWWFISSLSRLGLAWNVITFPKP